MGFRSKKDQLPEEGASQTGRAESKQRDRYDEANEWEARHVLNVQRSEKRAWGVAKVAVVSAVLPWVAIVAMMPLKESVPYLVKENAQGATTILTRVNWAELSYDEARDKSWAARYVMTRERYDWYTLQEDYDLVALLSSGDVGREYSAIYTGDNSRDKQLGNRVRVKVRVLSVVPNKNGNATVRYVTEEGAPDGSGKPIFKTYVATVSYEYVGSSTLPEEKRWLNPLGFRVTSYRRDSESNPGVQ